MRLETFLGSFQWHGPLRGIGLRRLSRRGAETLSRNDSVGREVIATQMLAQAEE